MIKFTDTYVSYKTGTRALRGVSMEINDGEFVFIVGPSGAGKSTLIKLFTAELRPSSGTALVNGFSIGTMKRREIPDLRRTVGVVYQDFKLIDRMTVYDNVAFAMHVVGVHDKNMISERVMYVLKLVGLERKAGRKPNELSGGEQQRAVIARALVNNPGTIIADEPTGNLDPARSLEIMELLVKINELGSTVVVITHEKELVNSFSKRVILIDGGRIAGERTGGYVGSMVTDGSELRQNSNAPEIHSPEEKRIVREMNAVKSGGTDAGGEPKAGEPQNGQEEAGTQFVPLGSDEPEFLRAFIGDESTPRTEESSPEAENIFRAIVGEEDRSGEAEKE